MAKGKENKKQREVGGRERWVEERGEGEKRIEVHYVHVPLPTRNIIIVYCKCVLISIKISRIIKVTLGSNTLSQGRAGEDLIIEILLLPPRYFLCLGFSKDRRKRP